MMMGRVRERSEAEFHLLRGLIIQLSATPDVDNESKVLMDFGSGTSVPVYVDHQRLSTTKVRVQIYLHGHDNPVAKAVVGNRS